MKHYDPIEDEDIAGAASPVGLTIMAAIGVIAFVFILGIVGAIIYGLIKLL